MDTENKTKQLTNKQLALYMGCEAMWSVPKYTWEKTIIDEELLYENFNYIKVNGFSKNIKPILRPITDFLEMDLVEWAKMLGQENSLDIISNDAVVKDVRKKGWKSFDGTLTVKQSILAVEWLLSRHFDIYDWINDGLAMDKTKLK